MIKLMNFFKSYPWQTKSVRRRLLRRRGCRRLRRTHDSYVLVTRPKKRVRLFDEGATMQ